MLVKSFLAWMDTAPVRERAEAVAMLTRAYLARALGGDSPMEVEAALTSILDDPSPFVRRELAMGFADRTDVPRHIVLSLAADQAEVSGLLIARSPLLTEADLIDLAVTGERMALMAIALRPDVTCRISHAIVARRDFDSAFVLAGNALAEIADADLLALVEAFGGKPRLREALLARGDLPGTARHALMLILAESLGGYVTGGGFLTPARNKRAMDETMQSGTVTIARSTGDALPGFIAHLREKGQLTPALLLRSVLGGETAFIAAALADLCGMDRARVNGLLASRSDAAIGALIRRAGIPGFLHPALTAAIRAAGVLKVDDRRSTFALPVVRAAQGACIDVPGEDGVRLMALLRRYEAEAARAESRLVAESLRREATDDMAAMSLLPPDIGPDMLRLSGLGDEAAVAEPEPASVEEAVVIARSEPRVLMSDRIQAVLSRTAPMREVVRTRGLVLDEPIPSLKSLIAEWKAERETFDRAEAERVAARFGNQNDKPGRSRVA